MELSELRKDINDIDSEIISCFRKEWNAVLELLNIK